MTVKNRKELEIFVEAPEKKSSETGGLLHCRGEESGKKERAKIKDMGIVKRPDRKRGRGVSDVMGKKARNGAGPTKSFEFLFSRFVSRPPRGGPTHTHTHTPFSLQSDRKDGDKVQNRGPQQKRTRPAPILACALSPPLVKGQGGV